MKTTPRKPNQLQQLLIAIEISLLTITFLAIILN